MKALLIYYIFFLLTKVLHVTIKLRAQHRFRGMRDESKYERGIRDDRTLAGGENGICPLLTDRIRDRRQDAGCKG